ncbi:DUF1449 domain-containing protein [Vibrio sp. Sgm 5]|uniref:DUF1449 domain-containing protein n=1 Tax=Vibrio sp. Sgm 5 TaxID=2994387 RepID=UPI002248A860|nr:DUF1449 domain-containing protein [Vibrio sp. Sgm 5]MCX2790633.1 DUF1449 domain-containing protein [Vibrio sp. Sgm 5]
MIDILLSFPTNVFFVPFVFLLLTMCIDLIFNVVDVAVADIDLFESGNLFSGGLLLPPILSKVPLAVGLCVSFFFATILSFYLSSFIDQYISSTAAMIAKVVSIPVNFYLSLYISAKLLSPLAPLFDKNKAFAKVDFVGMKAKVHSSEVNSQRGEIIVHHNGSEFLLDARIFESDVPIEYGNDVVIVFLNKQKKYYIINQ